MTLPPLMWAGNAIVGRMMVGTVPPLTLNFLRWALAAALLLPLAWRVLQRPGAIAARWTYLLPAGLLGVGAYNALQYQALVTTTPLNVTLIASTSPVWMLLVGALMHGVRPTRAQLAGAALSMSGALLVIVRGDAAALMKVQLVAGDLYILVAIALFAVYSWMLARPPAIMTGSQQPTVRDGQAERGWSWSEALLVQMLFGLLGAGAAAGVEQWQGVEPMAWDFKTWLVLAFVAVGPSIVAYRCWGLGVAAGGPTLAAFFGNLTPLFTAVMSSVVLGEWPRWYHVAAFALIVAGILVSQRRA